MKCLSIFILMLACSAKQSLAADKPSVDAGVWLDKAAAEFAPVRKETEELKQKPGALENIFTEQTLALMHFQCRADEAGRARLLELAHRTEKAKPFADTPLARMGHIDSVATLYAYAGARADAHRLLSALERSISEQDSFMADAMHSATAMIKARIGELDDAELDKLSIFDLRMMMQTAAAENRDEDIDRYLSKARKRIDNVGNAGLTDRKELAETAAKSGRLAQANEIAAQIPQDSYGRAEALAGIARVLYQSGDEAGCLQYLKAAFAAAEKTQKYSRRVSMGAVLGVAMDCDEKTMMFQSADACRELLNRAGDKPNETAFIARIATAYALSGRHEEFALAVASAEAALAKLKGERGDRYQVRYQIDIAAAYASAGDKAAADAAVLKAKSRGEVSVGDRAEFNGVADAYARIGDFDAARAALLANLPNAEEREYGFQHLAWRQIIAGHFAQAEQTAALIEKPYYRLLVHRWIVTQRIKAGKLDGLADWIAAHRTARERAVLYLAAAQQILGKEGKGTSAIFSPPL